MSTASRHAAGRVLLLSYDGAHPVRSLGRYVMRGRWRCLVVEDPLNATQHPGLLPLQTDISVALLRRPWRPKRAAARFEAALAAYRAGTPA